MSISQALLFLTSLQPWALWITFLPEAFSSFSSHAIAQSWFSSHFSDSSSFVYLSGFSLSISSLTMVLLHWPSPQHVQLSKGLRWCPPLVSWSQLIISLLPSDLTSTTLVCLRDRHRYLHSRMVWWLRAQILEPDCPVWIPAQLLPHCVILSQLLNLSVPWTKGR